MALNTGMEIKCLEGGGRIGDLSIRRQDVRSPPELRVLFWAKNINYKFPKAKLLIQYEGRSKKWAVAEGSSVPAAGLLV
jgi:hypothetical protein